VPRPNETHDKSAPSEAPPAGLAEALARATHDLYLRDQLAAGITSANNPSLVPWDELPESLKESSRAFAAGIEGKLQTVGAELVTEAGAALDDSRFEFSSEELESLARDEHERWVEDLVRQGWQRSHGPKNPERRLHPSLVPWDKLSEEEREKDRAAVRALPEIVSRAGLRLVRRTGEVRGE
jgi:hypothetical protein